MKCFKEELMILDMALMGCMELLQKDNSTKAKDNIYNVEKIIDKRWQETIMAMPRNCKGGPHDGGCSGYYCPCCQQNKEICKKGIQ